MVHHPTRLHNILHLESNRNTPATNYVYFSNLFADTFLSKQALKYRLHSGLLHISNGYKRNLL